MSCFYCAMRTMGGSPSFPINIKLLHTEIPATLMQPVYDDCHALELHQTSSILNSRPSKHALVQFSTHLLGLACALPKTAHPMWRMPLYTQERTRMRRIFSSCPTSFMPTIAYSWCHAASSRSTRFVANVWAWTFPTRMLDSPVLEALPRVDDSTRMFSQPDGREYNQQKEPSMHGYLCNCSELSAHFLLRSSLFAC
jgi:hypothetical protein